MLWAHPQLLNCHLQEHLRRYRGVYARVEGNIWRQEVTEWDGVRSEGLDAVRDGQPDAGTSALAVQSTGHVEPQNPYVAVH